MTAGFAILAYPAEYRNSGVMTFFINQYGVVFQWKVYSMTAVVESLVLHLCWAGLHVSLRAAERCPILAVRAIAPARYVSPQSG
jgi:hypothetical protein